jgi:hypothetical protein
MNVSFEMSPDEMKKLKLASTWRARRLYAPTWLTKCYWYLVLPLTIVTLGLLFNAMLAVAVSAILCLSLGRAANDLYRRIYNNNERKESTAGFIGAWTVQVEEGGLALKSKLVEYKYTWSYFHYVDVTADYLYLCASPTKHVVIPKRAFANKADLASFVADVDRRIQDAQHPSLPVEVG